MGQRKKKKEPCGYVFPMVSMARVPRDYDHSIVECQFDEGHEGEHLGVGIRYYAEADKYDLVNLQSFVIQWKDHVEVPTWINALATRKNLKEKRDGDTE